MFELKPMNKYLVIAPHKADEKVGSAGIIFAPGNALEKQHKLGRLVAIAECEEAKGLEVGMTVLYDTVGSVDHRVGNQMFTTVRVLNVLGIVLTKQDGTDELTKTIVEGHS